VNDNGKKRGGGIMETGTIGALLFRMLGVVMLLLGILIFLTIPVSYFSLLNADVLRDTYFIVNESIIWGGVFVIGGCVFLLLSKPLGRILAKGLE
jgi:hypothetical protein